MLRWYAFASSSSVFYIVIVELNYLLLLVKFSSSEPPVIRAHLLSLQEKGEESTVDFIISVFCMIIFDL